jgi:predicted metal-dependent phosphoesterase TrpH
MLHDLHSHSTASDGTLTPAELVARAHAQGVQVLALTDHDSTEGLAEASAAAQTLGVRLVPGVEISVTWHDKTVHIIGLHIDAAHDALQCGLARLRGFRDWRAEEIGRRLAQHGIVEAYAGARRYARGGIVSRTHFARFLVEQGRARAVRDVYAHYLNEGKPGYVAGEWATLEEALGWIHGAGGQAVIAHPARYKLSEAKFELLLDEFKRHGGAGMEVLSGSHTPDDCARMARHARRRGLLASQGTDYHGPEHAWLDLGRLPAMPEGCVPVWEHW